MEIQTIDLLCIGLNCTMSVLESMLYTTINPYVLSFAYTGPTFWPILKHDWLMVNYKSIHLGKWKYQFGGKELVKVEKCLCNSLSQTGEICHFQIIHLIMHESVSSVIYPWVYDGIELVVLIPHGSCTSQCHGIFFSQIPLVKFHLITPWLLGKKMI